jgi:hypothetical protein
VVTEIGGGTVFHDEGRLGLRVSPTADHQYTNAQITDYDYADFRFIWRPPVRMTVRARASLPASQMVGTAGFGFWNHPFSPDVRARRKFRMPQAIWYFFSSPPNDMALALDVPGSGWKAAMLDAGRPTALFLTPFALPALLVMQVPALYRKIYPRIQRALAIAECRLNDALLTEMHTYALEWHDTSAVFKIDDQIVLRTPFAPRGPCGFVAWVDNQYAIITPQGRFGSGVTRVAREQTLWIERILVEALD